jgi:hypothetical protein
VTRGDAATDLDTTPISAADYAMYAAIMGGASAILSTLSPTDREALAFAKKVDAGQARATPETEQLLTQARALQHKDIELARTQGIEERYVRVKARIRSGHRARREAAGCRRCGGERESALSRASQGQHRAAPADPSRPARA